MRNRLVLVTFASLTLAVVLGWSPSTLDAQKPAKLRLAVHGSLMGAPDVIAIREGYFKEAGLDVDWRRFALGKEGRDAMIAGAIDVNATAPTPFMIGLDKGVPYTAIGINSVFCSATHVVVLKSSDLNSVAQLRGKRIGLPKGTITEYVFMTRIVPSFGLKPEDFQVANIPDAKDHIPSLVAKAVDMTTLGEPHTAIGEKDGTVRIIENFCKYDPMPFMLTATNKIIQEHPDAVVAYLRGWLKAVKLLKDDPKKAATVYAEEQRSLGRTVDADVIVTALGRMRWEPDLTPDIEKYLVDQAKDLATPAGGRRVISAVPNIAKALNRDLLAKARAGR
jgi:sulfonate transport system substrate-binding protein